MIQIKNKEQLETILNENNAVVLDFFAEWCGPCKQLKKRLDEPDTKQIMPKLVVGYLDVDDEENSSIINKYKIMIKLNLKFVII